MAQEVGKERVLRAMHMGAVEIARIAKAMYEEYGDKALAIIRDKNFKAGVLAFPAVAKGAGIRTGDGTMEDWLKLARLLGSKALLEYETEYTPERAVFRVTYCPFAEAYKTMFPDYCRRVVTLGTDGAIAAVINPNLEVHGDCYITEGAATCDIVCEWKPETKP